VLAGIRLIRWDNQVCKKKKEWLTADNFLASAALQAKIKNKMVDCCECLLDVVYQGVDQVFKFWQYAHCLADSIGKGNSCGRAAMATFLCFPQVSKSKFARTHLHARR